MDRFTYPVTLTRDESGGGYVVTFRDVPEAITQGETVADSLEQAAGALEAAVLGRIKSGMFVPIPSEPLPAEMDVPLPLQAAMKAALYLAMKAADVSEAELARRLPVHREKMLRILDPHQSAELPIIESAFSALGRRIELNVI